MAGETAASAEATAASEAPTYPYHRGNKIILDPEQPAGLASSGIWSERSQAEVVDQDRIIQKKRRASADAQRQRADGSTNVWGNMDADAARVVTARVAEAEKPRPPPPLAPESFVRTAANSTLEVGTLLDCTFLHQGRYTAGRLGCDTFDVLVWRGENTPDDAPLLLYMHGSGGAQHTDLLYWPRDLLSEPKRKKKWDTENGVPPPDYLADKILVLPMIEGSRSRDKHKTPPTEDFYAIIQWFFEFSGPFYACGSSRGSMWLEHGIRERPECFEAVLLTGSYANSDYFANTPHNQSVMGQALQRVPLPVIACMSPIDLVCGTAKQPEYWACFRTADGIVDSPGSLLQLEIFETWTHDELSAFFSSQHLSDDKRNAIHPIWVRFFNLVRYVT